MDDWFDYGDDYNLYGGSYDNYTTGTATATGDETVTLPAYNVYSGDEPTSTPGTNSMNDDTSTGGFWDSLGGFFGDLGNVALGAASTAATNAANNATGTPSAAQQQQAAQQAKTDKLLLYTAIGLAILAAGVIAYKAVKK